MCGRSLYLGAKPRHRTLRDLSAIAEFLPRHAVRKRGLCCGPVSIHPSIHLAVCLSVCLPVTFVHSIQTAEDIVKLLSRSGSPIILVF